MKIMRLLLVGALLSTSVVFAQKKSVEEVAEKKVEKLTEKIDLSKEQADKIQTLTVEFITLKKKIKADESINEEAQKTQIKEAGKANRDQIKEILTDQQLAKLKEFNEERKNIDPKKQAEKRTKLLTDKLELTENQVERVKVLSLKVTEKIKAIIEDDSMSREKKKEFIEGNKTDYKNAMKSILTADQFVKYEVMLEEMKAKKEVKHDEMK